MLDATSFSGTFWVFHTGLTDPEYTLTVTDTQTGTEWVYRNEQRPVAPLRRRRHRRLSSLHPSV